MLAIGFTKKYYTLWDVQCRDNYGTNHMGQVTSNYKSVIYTYLGNLSMDLSSAQEKAKMRGCIDLEPSHDLYGRNKSWENVTPKEIIKEGLESCERDELISICCSNNPENTKEAREWAIKILIKKGFCEMVGDVLTYTEHVESMKKYFSDRDMFLNTEIKNNIFINKNVDSEGVIYIREGHINYELTFLNGTKSNYYNGFNYYLPLGVDGKAKRIKNKTITLTDFEVEKTTDSVPYGCWTDSLLGIIFYTENTPVGQFNGTVNIKVKNFKI